jgi:hypothetical protein
MNLRDADVRDAGGPEKLKSHVTLKIEPEILRGTVIRRTPPDSRRTSLISFLLIVVPSLPSKL